MNYELEQGTQLRPRGIVLYADTLRFNSTIDKHFQQIISKGSHRFASTICKLNELILNENHEYYKENQKVKVLKDAKTFLIGLLRRFNDNHERRIMYNINYYAEFAFIWFIRCNLSSNKLPLKSFQINILEEILNTFEGIGRRALNYVMLIIYNRLVQSNVRIRNMNHRRFHPNHPELVWETKYYNKLLYLYRQINTMFHYFKLRIQRKLNKAIREISQNRTNTLSRDEQRTLEYILKTTGDIGGYLM